ncbi:MAG: hypothetical protein VX541_03040 [Candidatus Poribacteria bacterium]|nr:hypothetical protein [Candidatus Poribacteria bacterium]
MVSPHNLLPLPVTRNTAIRFAYDMRQSLVFSEASSVFVLGGTYRGEKPHANDIELVTSRW